MLVIEGSINGGGKVAIPVSAVQCIVKEKVGNKWKVKIYTGYGEATYDEFEIEDKANEKYTLLLTALQEYDLCPRQNTR